jgi:hypothetical protein
MTFAVDSMFLRTLPELLGAGFHSIGHVVAYVFSPDRSVGQIDD